MTAMLVELSWISFLIPPEMVPGRAGLLITLCLVLTNYFIYAEESSPSISGITPMHIWCNMCLMMAIFAFMEYAYLLFYIRFGHKRIKENSKIGGLNNLSGQQSQGIVPISNKESSKKTLEDHEKIQFHNWAKSVDSYAIKIFPLAFVIFTITYWFYFTNFFSQFRTGYSPFFN